MTATVSLADIKRKLNAKRPKAKTHGGRFLSSGLDVLDLACSGEVGKAFLPGHFYLLVGDSAAGKTFLLEQLFAEAAHNAAFTKYQLVKDNPERGSLMDIPRFFGEATARRVAPPPLRGRSSRTLEEMYDQIGDAMARGKPVLYGVDSEDALLPEADLKKHGKNRKARTEGDAKGIKGSYGMDKAKINSSHLRGAHVALEDQGSMLVMIKQTRQNTGPGGMFKPKTRSGGLALTFYGTLELWFSIAGKLKRKVSGTSRKIGTVLRIEVKKNRVSGRETEVLVPFYPTSGFDNTGANVLYLVAERHWAKAGKKDEEEGGFGGDRMQDKITAPEFEFTGTCEKLVERIEAEGRIEELRDLVVQVWRNVEEACSVERTSRYK